jgi:hypothetical protein
VQDCNILIVLYNGNAGFADKSNKIGICHAELAEAIRNSPDKVRIVDVNRDASVGKRRLAAGEAERNRLFEHYLNVQRLPRSFAADDVHALRLISKALQDAIVGMVRLGNREGRKGRYYAGAPLDWSRYDFSQRKSVMEKVVLDTLPKLPIHTEVGANLGEICIVDIKGTSLLFCCNAVPAAMSTPSAREMVGRPFLHDHELVAATEQNSAVGPVHLIACHKSVTETQAVNLLGFPDATIVTPPFGVYVAHNIQNIQIVLLANCRDDTSTRHAIQRFLDWLSSSGEADFLTKRACKRTAIVTAIAAQSQITVVRGSGAEGG